MNIHEYLKEKGELSLGQIIRKIDEFQRFEYLGQAQLKDLAILLELLRLTCIISAENLSEEFTLIPVL